MSFRNRLILRNQRGVTCPYCTLEAQLVYGDTIYFKKELEHQIFYYCAECKAVAACKDGSDEPKTTLANANMRKIRAQLYALLDQLQAAKLASSERKGQRISKRHCRDLMQQWLAKELQIDLGSCEVGKLTEDQCKRAIRVCEGIFKKG